MILLSGLYCVQYLTWPYGAPHHHDKLEQVNFHPSTMFWILNLCFFSKLCCSWFHLFNSFQVFSGPWSLILCSQASCMIFSASNPLASFYLNNSKMFSQWLFSRNAKINLTRSSTPLHQSLFLTTCVRLIIFFSPSIMWGLHLIFLFFWSFSNLFCSYFSTCNKKSL